MAGTNISRANGSGSATTKFTLSMWVKRGITDQGRMFSATGGSGDVYFRFNAGGVIEWSGHGSNASSAGYFITNRTFRDYTGWYHFVIRFDSTQASASDRLRFYVNGVQETDFSTSTNPNQDVTDNISLSSNTHYWGGTISSQYFDGLISHVHYTVGNDYGPDSFGSTDPTSGQWKITTSPSVTYGSAGYFILKDGNSLTDQSPNSNNFAVANGTLTNTEDSPNNLFANWNPLVYTGTQPTYSNGNTVLRPNTNANYIEAVSTIGMPQSGKYYAEFKKFQNDNVFMVGIGDYQELINAMRVQTNVSQSGGGYGYALTIRNGGDVRQPGESDISSFFASSISNGDIIGVAVDMDNKAVYAHKNGTYGAIGGVTGVPTSGSSKTGAIDLSSKTWFTGASFIGFLFGTISTSGWDGVDANFGNGYFGTTQISTEGTNASNNGKFEYDTPTGYTALSTKGLNL